MNLNKKLIAGAVVAAVAISSSGSAFAEGHGRDHDVAVAAGVILGAAVIGSLISANSQPQPVYAQPAYYPAQAQVSYTYSAPVAYGHYDHYDHDHYRHEHYDHHDYDRGHWNH